RVESTVVLRSNGGPPFPRRDRSPFLRYPSHQAHRLIRGFASSPRGEFALVGKGFSVLQTLYARSAPDRIEVSGLTAYRWKNNEFVMSGEVRHPNGDTPKYFRR